MALLTGVYTGGTTTEQVPISVDTNGIVYVRAATATPVDTNIKQVGGTATAVNNGSSSAGTMRVTIADDSTGLVSTKRKNKVGVVNVTGSAAINTTTTISEHIKLTSITCHFDTAPVASENFVVTLDALDGAEYDTVLFTVNPSLSASTDIVYNESIELEDGDEIKVTFTNTNTRTYGLRIVYEVL